MRALETYGSPVAAPEVLEELREALVKRFGSVTVAFEALSASAGAGRVSDLQFERFFASQAQATTGAGAPVSKAASERKAALKEWVTKTYPEDRVAVFASLNPSGGEAIDLTDFLSLNLHTAVLAVRRLQHFQSWLFEQ